MMKKILALLLASLLTLLAASAMADGIGAQTPFETQSDITVENHDDPFYIEETGVYSVNNGAGKFKYDANTHALTVTEGAVTISGTSNEDGVKMGDAAVTLTNGKVTLNKADSTVSVLAGGVTVSGTSAENGVTLVGNLTATLNSSTVAVNSTASLITVDGGSITLSGSANTTVEVAGNTTVILNGVTLTGNKGPALRIKAGVTATVQLDGDNTLTGADGYAGLEVGWDSEDSYAHLTILGNGALEAIGGSNSAGIGGSKSNHGLYGDITINGGNINATGKGGGSGIGSADNPNNGKSNGSYRYSYERWGVITINGENTVINATGGSNGAGIGGGNHVDSGLIIINDGHITAVGHVGIGCSTGSSKNKGNQGDKGPGYYYSTIEINGGTINASATSGSNGAGIGGGMYCDASVLITGGTVTATGGSGSNNYHHGGAGIGGGYLGHANVNITGGSVTATGGAAAAGIGSGGSPNANPDRGINGRSLDNSIVYLLSTTVSISGGEVTATAGSKGGAGIGGGTSADSVSVNISGGKIWAYGSLRDRSEPEHFWGGAGIGSGINGEVTGDSAKYHFNTNVNVQITGGDVYAEGGWGAAGIGSGADNQRVNSLSISADAKVEAYSDGTKFALDTRDSSNTRVSGNMFQGTFMFPWLSNSGTQDARGIKLTVTNDLTGKTAQADLPDGYRSFAVNAPGAGYYTVYSTDGHVANGKGCYFSVSSKEGERSNTDSQPNNKNNETALLRLNTGELSDNYFLYPVKTIMVEKQIATDGTLDLSGIQMTAYFRLKVKGEDSYVGHIQSIEIKNGVPQNKAYFANVLEGNYSIQETDKDGKRLALNTMFGTAELKSIETRDHHSETGTDNTGVISADTWKDDVTIINTFGIHIDNIDVSGVKTWVDDNNRDGVRPGSITVNLLADGVQVASQTVTGTDNAWSYTFKDVPKAKDGKDIVYTVSEAAVSGYTAVYNGMNITNTHTPEVITVSGSKTWVDDNNRDGLRPDSITVNLLADGTQVDTATVTAAGGWSWSFTDKPRYAQGAVGREIVYTVSEAPVSGYTATVTGYNITNTHEPARISVSGTKVWDDNNDSDGVRPGSITVNLLADGRQVDSRAVTGTGDSWSFTFEDLYRYANGREITYTVTEEAVANYTASISGTTITNTHTPETVSVSGSKIWDDQDDKDGLRPASVTVNLLADGVRKDSKTVSAGDGWSFSFTDLPKYSHGREIQYTVSENAPAGYTASVSGYNITNTHTPENITVSGTKTWVDHDNKDGLRPASVTINLLADGVQKNSRTVSGSGDTWSYSFTDLPKYADGKEIVYSVTEDTVPEYETNVIGFNVFNVHNPKGEDTKLYKLTVRYWADGKKVFPDVNATYKYGDKYNVTSPTLPGYTVDLAVVDGVIYQDTVRDVYYTPADVHLTIYYQYLDGTTAADTYYSTLHAGDGYSVVSPIIENYIVDRALVDGVMPGHDVEIVVYYTPVGILVVEKVPVEKREKDKSYLIDDYGTPLGLGSVELNAGETFD